MNISSLKDEISSNVWFHFIDIFTSTEVQYLNTPAEQDVNKSFNGLVSDKQARQILVKSNICDIITHQWKIYTSSLIIYNK